MARHKQTAWQHIRRSPYQTLAAVAIMTLTFLALTVFSFLLVGSYKVLNFFEGKPQVTAFFKDEAKQEDIDTLKNQLSSSPKIAEVKFISKQQALDIYKAQNKNDPLLLELVTADILPASLEVSTFKIADLSDVASSLKNTNIVQEVVFQKDVVSTLTSWTTAMRQIGIVVIVLLSAVSLFIMVTIISIKVAHKREEIEIMRLIGATNWYIAFPFVYEGIFYATTGALLGWSIGTAGLLYFSPSLSSFLKGIPLFPVSLVFIFGLLGGEILLAVILGFFASTLAVRRYVD